MKLKEIFYGIGLKLRPREYSYDVDHFVLPQEGEIAYARWRHPLERRKEFTQGSVDAIRSFLSPGDVAIDIGAHTGDTALPIALAVGRAGAVLALEPNPYVFKILLANSALNRGKTNIIPLMFAATPEDREYDFEYSDRGFCNGGLHHGVSRWRHAHFFKLRVVGRNLVKFLRAERPEEWERVRYVKIDTEGFDRCVTASLKELLVRNRPFIRSEVFQHVPAEERHGYHDDLRELGYRVYRFNSDEDYVGMELSRDQMMNWKQFDLFAVPEEPARLTGPGRSAAQPAG